MNITQTRPAPRRRIAEEEEKKFENDHSELVYNRMMEIRGAVSKYQNTRQAIHVSTGQLRAAISQIDNAIGRDNRNDLLTNAYRRPIASSKELTDAEAFGLVLWVGMHKEEKWHPGVRFVSDIPMMQEWYGQIRFF